MFYVTESNIYLFRVTESNVKFMLIDSNVKGER